MKTIWLVAGLLLAIFAIGLFVGAAYSTETPEHDGIHGT
jgi:hypothetical protein